LLFRNVANTFNVQFTNTATDDRILTLPNANTTLVGRGTVDTLTNKIHASGNSVTTGFAYAAGTKQTFSPDGTNAGLNVGLQAGNPSSLADGDIWVNTSTNQIFARVNGISVDLGASGSANTLAGLTDTDISAPASGQLIIYDGVDSWNNQSISGDATLSNAGVLTIANGVINDANLIPGTFSAITGLGTQLQTLQNGVKFNIIRYWTIIFKRTWGNEI
jgi:hypothetical protein